METKELNILNRETKKINKEADKNLKNFKASLNEITELQGLLSPWYISNYATPSVKKAINKGTISLKDAKSKMLSTYIKRANKKTEKDIKEVETILNAGNVTEISITVEWSENQTWGANPTAEVRVYGDEFEFLKSRSVSGCGYDKESTAFAEAVNQSNAVRKILLMNKNKIKDIYGHRNSLLSGGVGSSCFLNIFKALKYKAIKTASGKMFDAYLITKNPIHQKRY